MSSPPSLKRQRVDDDNGASDIDHGQTRHPDLWFEDGNVILSVKDTFFRVYRGILANASPVFRDLFTVPQPPDGETMDGCPVIRLQDPKEDMENFLKVLFKGVRAVRTKEARASWPITRALIRLGDKYQIDELLQEGKERLLVRLPDGIDDWDALYYPEGTDHAESAPSDEIQVIAMANISRQLKMRDTLARAIYRCIRLESSTILAGCPGADGVHEFLSTENLALCMDIRPSLLIWDARMRSDLVFGSPAGRGHCCIGQIKSIQDDFSRDLVMPALEKASLETSESLSTVLTMIVQ
ncbi:hypothetical protein EIP91_004959 [Steccherinum ochraceum]|uniref:BTB domain-containing protein n=1 Tax=Steccherinum ochraceum TaxID=92696 RepID=A0A4R0RAH0_9APHY|nr:hypothetical protein EIP91_004959 [Steccherinum ochraceum]